jgi:hypothetical protein
MDRRLDQRPHDRIGCERTGAARRRRESGQPLLVERREHRPDDVPDQPLLAAEVIVDRRRIGAGVLGDLPDGDVGKAPVGEQHDGAVENPSITVHLTLGERYIASVYLAERPRTTLSR